MWSTGRLIPPGRWKPVEIVISSLLTVWLATPPTCLTRKTRSQKRGPIVLAQMLSPQGHHQPPRSLGFYSVAFDLEFYSPKSEELLLACPNSASFPDLFPQFAQLYRSWSVKRPGYLVHAEASSSMSSAGSIPAAKASLFPHNQGIERCIELIHANYQHTYSSRELAEVAGVSPSYFRYLFKQSTGLSPLQYQNQIKIDKAKDLLLSGECNVTEAGGGCGLCQHLVISAVYSRSSPASRLPNTARDKKPGASRKMLRFLSSLNLFIDFCRCLIQHPLSYLQVFAGQLAICYFRCQT